MAEILVVSNRKGGTGKTTVSVNLAAEWAASGRRVLLVDLDTQNHCATGLGLKLTRGQPTVHDLFRDGHGALGPAVVATAFPNLAVVPANPLFEHGSGLHDEGLLFRALADGAIHAAFDRVILDTPPSLDLLLISALNAADAILVPYVPHPLSFEGVRQLMRVLFRVKSGVNPDLRILGFLPVMVADHIRQHRAITGEIGRQFGAPKVLSGIRTDIKLAEAFGAGLPIRHYAPKSRGAEDFAALGAALGLVLAGGPAGGDRPSDEGKS